MSRRRLLVSTAAVWLLGFGALRLSLLAPEECPPVDPAEALDAAARAGDWIAAGVTPDGRYLYEFDRTSGESRSGYNIVRHAGVTMSLYQLAAADPPNRDEVMAVADEGLDYMIDRLDPAGDGEALTELGVSQAKLGASALMAAALEDRREATDDPQYDDTLRALGRFLDGQIQPDGRALGFFDLDKGAPVPDLTSRYATGEAGWALARLHTLFPDEGWDDPARRVSEYLATRRDADENMDFAPWPDQWAAYLLAERAPSGLSEAEADYARALAERFGMLIRSESQKGGYPVPHFDITARGAGLGVWVEGLGSMTRVADVDERLADLRPVLQERLACGAGILVDRQVSAGDAEDYPEPALTRDAWFRDDVTRMDDQQHALSGLLEAAELTGGSR